MAGILENINVVSFYPWTPSVPCGAWMRFSSLLRYLTDNGANVTALVCDNKPDVELERLKIHHYRDFWTFNSYHLVVSELDELRSDAGRSLQGDEQAFYDKFNPRIYSSHKNYEAWVAHYIAAADIVTLEYPFMAEFLAPICRRLGKPLIITAHDCITNLHAKTDNGKRLLLEAEINSLRLGDALFTVSEDDARGFGTFGLKSSVVINTGDALGTIPNEFNQASGAMLQAIGIPQKQMCLFVGSNHPPNVEAIQVIRWLAQQLPQYAFIVAGNCCEQEITSNFYAFGMVNEKLLDQLYRAASAVVIPLLRGSGTSLKFFQAMVYGKPVITTSVGARGHAIENGKEAFVCDELERLPSLISGILENRQVREKLVLESRRYAVTLDFRKVFAPYGETILRLLGKNPALAQNSSAEKNSKLIVVDNNLADDAGHHLPYCLSLKDEAREEGFDFAALIKKTALPGILSALSARPVFSQGIHEECKNNHYPREWGDLFNEQDFLGSNQLFYTELSNALKEVASDRDVVFLPNATQRQILGLAVFIKSLPLYITPRFVILLRYSFYYPERLPDDTKVMRVNEVLKAQLTRALEALESVAYQSNIRIVTDSAGLAKEYSEITSLPLEVLPIPHTQEGAPTSSAGRGLVPAKKPGKVRFVALGDAREEKGFHLLAYLIARLMQDNATEGLEFVFQAHISSDFHSPMAVWVKNMKTFQCKELTLIETPLNGEEYHELIESADIVLLPYDSLTYRSRTSGPFVESVCHGKPVIVPAETWLGEQLGNSGAGVAYNGTEAEDFVIAVKAAVATLPHLKERAAVFSRQFREFHNPKTFMQKLMLMPGAAPLPPQRAEAKCAAHTPSDQLTHIVGA